MKICFLLGSGFPVPAIKGGAIETLLEMIIEAKQNTNDNLEISVITKKSDAVDYSRFNKIEFIFVPRLYIIFEKIYWKFYGFFKKVFNIELVAPLSRIFERNYVKKNFANFDYLIEETSLNIYKNTAIPKDKIIYHLHYGGEKEFCNDQLFGNLIAISDYIKSNWVKNTGRDLQDTFVLKNCIDINRFSKSLSVTHTEKMKIMSQIGIPEGNKVIIYVGRIIPEKGVLELIKAFNKIKYNKVSLLLIGSASFSKKTMTDYEMEVQDQIHLSDKQIITTGFIHNSELYKYHAVADLAVIPSIWQEPAGLVELEFQAAGVPIIATRVGGIPEFVSKKCKLVDAENLIDNLTSTIDKIINDDRELKLMRDEGIAFSKTFNKQNYYIEFLNIINTIYERDQ